MVYPSRRIANKPFQRLLTEALDEALHPHRPEHDLLGRCFLDGNHVSPQIDPVEADRGEARALLLFLPGPPRFREQRAACAFIPRGLGCDIPIGRASLLASPCKDGLSRSFALPKRIDHGRWRYNVIRAIKRLMNLQKASLLSSRGRCPDRDRAEFQPAESRPAWRALRDEGSLHRPGATSTPKGACQLLYRRKVESQAAQSNPINQ